MLNAFIIFNTFLLATRLSKCRGTACAVRILNRRLPNNNNYWYYYHRFIQAASIKRDIVFSLWNNICFALHRRIRGFIGKNILASYSKSTQRGQRSTSNMHLCTCLVYDHFCSGVNQEQHSWSQCTRRSTNTNQCSSLTSYKNPTDMIRQESAIRPCPRSPCVHMLLFITKYDLSAWGLLGRPKSPLHYILHWSVMTYSTCFNNLQWKETETRYILDTLSDDEITAKSHNHTVSPYKPTFFFKPQLPV